MEELRDRDVTAERRRRGDAKWRSNNPDARSKRSEDSLKQKKEGARIAAAERRRRREAHSVQLAIDSTPMKIQLPIV